MSTPSIWLQTPSTGHYWEVSGHYVAGAWYPGPLEGCAAPMPPRMSARRAELHLVFLQALPSIRSPGTPQVYEINTPGRSFSLEDVNVMSVESLWCASPVQLRHAALSDEHCPYGWARGAAYLCNCVVMLTEVVVSHLVVSRLACFSHTSALARGASFLLESIVAASSHFCEQTSTQIYAWKGDNSSQYSDWASMPSRRPGPVRQLTGLSRELWSLQCKPYMTGKREGNTEVTLRRFTQADACGRQFNLPRQNATLRAIKSPSPAPPMPPGFSRGRVCWSLEASEYQGRHCGLCMGGGVCIRDMLPGLSPAVDLLISCLPRRNLPSSLNPLLSRLDPGCAVGAGDWAGSAARALEDGWAALGNCKCKAPSSIRVVSLQFDYESPENIGPAGYPNIRPIDESNLIINTFSRKEDPSLVVPRFSSVRESSITIVVFEVFGVEKK
ncbi:hypothetical protein K466DRAFT_570468 [Polyporus arcularius HHB13444]|uniref:Uncharacterized protein n=1 Tax=Polyporus arcularius HHB13444 TaxID=1314778 RepID=A0A5C3NP71_9APHY|nr:hypothetical protein K466DRAFT_570468 [Polyporus arcularius HHB13444]